MTSPAIHKKVPTAPKKPGNETPRPAAVDNTPFTEDQIIEYEKSLAKHVKHIPDHDFKHYNDALGKQINSKAEYLAEMRRGHFVPYDLTRKWAEDFDRKHQLKGYKPSKKAIDIIRSLQMTADKDGNISLGGRALKALREIGAIPSEAAQRNILERLKEEKLLCR